ncbi:acyl-CoA dehydrogenase [Natranaerofaba carboxydovora]|uniref:acyl-CoA dehydrogenase n=1 Tax=Natranaerofaba carboxydovora TaxID=2742683 RepID=UPI001F13B69D|nr:acyl-CoA dehydrogenase [Natranaerofaba carboxydovora]UMZ74614.1 Acyl-CoA dehydrogenase [Natranaerofaba carboxydovora]
MDFNLTDEQRMMQKLVKDFADKEVAPGAAERDEKEEFDRGLFDQMAEIGLTGIPWPEQYGGAEADYISYAIAVEEISRVCASTGVLLSAHISLAGSPIYYFGSEDQKQKYLKPMAEGEKLGAFGLTEPAAGSDVANMKTTAVKDGDEYILNGTKIFITNGEVADTYVVFAATDKEKAHKGISAFIVEKGTPGFSFGKEEEKLGIRSSKTTELVFEDCRVPAENLLGNEGDGFKIAMKTLDNGRTGIAAQALGIAQGAFEAARDYSKEREQFGRPISKFQAISFMLSDMATNIEAARLLTYQAAYKATNDDPLFPKYSAMAKLYASETAMDVTTNAVQVLGGYGYTREYPVERMMRDAKITEIYEGTSEVHRLVISRYITQE